MKRRKRCSWCDELIEVGQELRRKDAADLTHYFHKKCWKAHCDWLKEFSSRRRR
jgi:hypothetical protein